MSTIYTTTWVICSASCRPMTFSDMDKYLNPIMNTLATNTSVGLPDPFDQEMMQIYGALSPVQLLYSCSGSPIPT